MHCKPQFLKAEVVQRILHPCSPAWMVGRLPLEENQPYSQVTNCVNQIFVLDEHLSFWGDFFNVVFTFVFQFVNGLIAFLYSSWFFTWNIRQIYLQYVNTALKISVALLCPLSAFALHIEERDNVHVDSIKRWQNLILGSELCMDYSAALSLQSSDSVYGCDVRSVCSCD